jgi:hypothetical protein
VIHGVACGDHRCIAAGLRDVEVRAARGELLAPLAIGNTGGVLGEALIATLRLIA